MATHLLAVKDLTPNIWHNLIEETFRIHSKGSSSTSLYTDKHAALLFMEPSTRTQVSFSMACSKLGIQTHSLDVGGSSLTKGETLKDTLLNLQAMGINALITRIKDENLLRPISNELNSLSIICAGEGKTSHPSQALLDACTIYESFKKIDGLKILFIGDIEHSRVYQSNLEWMKWFSNEIYYISPKSEGLFNVNKGEADKSGLWENILHEFDVIIMLRPQLERHDSKNIFSPEEYFKKLGINENRHNKISKNCLIMHPGPFYTNVEFDEKLISKSNFKIYRQVHWGVFARMSMIKYILENQNA